MWSPQLYINEGLARQVPPEVLRAATSQLDAFYSRNDNIPALLTLGHLAQRSGVPYGSLRSAIERKGQSYNHFTIRKRSRGRRTISVPNRDLLMVQKWLTKHILNKQPVHSSSYAFKPGSSIFRCASRHTGTRWLVKMDISGFFGAISEIAVFRVFRGLGYEPLVAFELARLTTCVTSNWRRYLNWRWLNYYPFYRIESYNDERIGHLPQGAPTSPMLSNLVMVDTDNKIAEVARRNDLIYTRYSDDLTFSTRGSWTRSRSKLLVHSVSKILRTAGFFPNDRKTKIIPPGGRKIVLGLLVDGDSPRLSRKFRGNLRQHMYYIEKYGPVEHMMRRNFETILGMKHHIKGHIDYARMMEDEFGIEMLRRYEKIDWPV